MPAPVTSVPMAPRRPSDNEVADSLMYQMRGIVDAPAMLYRRWVDAKDYLETLRSRAYSIPPVRYDKDRVRSSNISDLSDTVDIIIRAEQAEFSARMAYIGALGSLDYLMDVAKFDSTTQRIWRLYYCGKGYTMEEIAARLHLTRAQVKYAIHKLKHRVALCLAVDRIAESIIDEEEEESYV